MRPKLAPKIIAESSGPQAPRRMSLPTIVTKGANWQNGPWKRRPHRGPFNRTWERASHQPRMTARLVTPSPRRCLGDDLVSSVHLLCVVLCSALSYKHSAQDWAD